PIHRAPGSLGACSSPSMVFKNKHMAGQWGHEQVTVQNLSVVRVDVARNLLLIKGAIPGPKGGLVIVKESVKG
ncbi:MAG: 50S ribosomal protein L3, partial [Clostridia bacterium]|nr:50S ribosomal protein L3 [Clostridia bacterium]